MIRSRTTGEAHRGVCARSDGDVKRGGARGKHGSHAVVWWSIDASFLTLCLMDCCTFTR